MTTLRTLIGIPLIVLSGSAFAQSTDQNSRRLESCFQAARLADSICNKQADPGERLGCLENTRAVQIECIRPILPEQVAITPKTSGPSAVLTRDAAQPAPVASSTAATTGASKGASSQPDMRPTAAEVAVTHNHSAAVIGPAETVQPTEVARPAEAIKPTETGQPMQVAKSAEPALSAEVSKPADTAHPAEDAKPVEMARPVEADLPGATTDVKAVEAKWIVSETTSPVDYSPLVSATIWPRQQVNSGLSGLTISCRAKRIELSLRLMGDLDVPRWGEIRIDSQIGDQRPVKLRWIWDEQQGTILSYMGDPVALLQSIPEGAILRLGVGDSKGARHMATYQLFGLDAVRNKVASACAWPSPSVQASSEKR